MSKLRNDGLAGGFWAYFAPPGWASQWWWPEDTHGKVWNLFHGYGWRVM